jgi:hypothetical protein
VSVVEWGVTCSLVVPLLTGWGFICGRWRLGLCAGLVLGAADFLRGLLARGGGSMPGSWWGACSLQWPFPLASLWASLYLSWAFYPLLLVVARVRSRTLVSIFGVIVIAAMTSWAMPVEPPWSVGASVRSAAAVPVLREIVASDVSPSSAFPSVHVALAFAVALSEKSWSWTWGAIATSVVVVLAGEHWILDCLGGLLLAVLVVLIVSISGGSTVMVRTVRRVRWTRLFGTGKGLNG